MGLFVELTGAREILCAMDNRCSRCGKPVYFGRWHNGFPYFLLIIYTHKCTIKNV